MEGPGSLLLLTTNLNFPKHSRFSTAPLLPWCAHFLISSEWINGARVGSKWTLKRWRLTTRGTGIEVGCFHRLNQVWTMVLASSPSSVASESFDRGRKGMAFTQVALVRPLLGGSQLSSLDYSHHDFRKKSIRYQSAGGLEGNRIDLERYVHTCSLRVPGTCRYTTLPGYHDFSCIPCRSPYRTNYPDGLSDSS